MKKVIFFVVALALMAGSVNAGPKAYIGLYIDEGHSICQLLIEEYYQEWITYVFILPSDEGLSGAEFKLVGPTFLRTTDIVVNENITVAMGTPFDAEGVSVAFGPCMTDWTWTHAIGCMSYKATGEGVPAFIEIVERPDAGAYQITICDPPDYSLRPVTILNHLALSQDCIIANEDASWGAIKGMYNE